MELISARMTFGENAFSQIPITSEIQALSAVTPFVRASRNASTSALSAAAFTERPSGLDLTAFHDLPEAAVIAAAISSLSAPEVTGSTCTSSLSPTAQTKAFGIPHYR